MKIQMRRNVFETNSSSTHALVYSKEGIEPSKFILDKDGYLWIDYGDYECWSDDGYGTFTEQYDKLSYLITQCYFATGQYAKDIFDTYNFREIEEAICEYTGAKGIKIKGDVEPQLNHQLMPEFGSIEIVDVYDHDAVINYVFNPRIALVLGRD